MRALASFGHRSPLSRIGFPPKGNLMDNFKTAGIKSRRLTTAIY
jgi:hypothetical protein